MRLTNTLFVHMHSRHKTNHSRVKGNAILQISISHPKAFARTGFSQRNDRDLVSIIKSMKTHKTKRRILPTDRTLTPVAFTKAMLSLSFSKRSLRHSRIHSFVKSKRISSRQCNHQPPKIVNMLISTCKKKLSTIKKRKRTLRKRISMKMVVLILEGLEKRKIKTYPLLHKPCSSSRVNSATEKESKQPPEDAFTPLPRTYKFTIKKMIKIHPRATKNHLF